MTLWTEKDWSSKTIFFIFLQAHQLCICLFQPCVWSIHVKPTWVCEMVKTDSLLKQESMRLFWPGVLTAFKDAGGHEIYQPRFYCFSSNSQVILLPKLVSLLQGEWLNGDHALLLKSSSLLQAKHTQKDSTALRRKEHRALTLGISVDCSMFWKPACLSWCNT